MIATGCRTCFALLFGVSVATTHAAPKPAEDCLTDLNAIPAFMLENDAGGKDVWEQRGELHFQKALEKARVDAAQVTTPEACVTVLRSYLKAWRKGHLSLRNNQLNPSPIKIPADGSWDPKLALLSDQTAMLTLPTFGPPFREPLEKLLKDNHLALTQHPNWIIDVRNNNGGSDSTYYALLDWLLPDEMAAVHTTYLVTPHNIHVQETVCDATKPEEKSCAEELAKVVKRMKLTQTGNYMLGADEAIEFDRVDKLEPVRPQRVAVLIDKGCGSSCEQFVLAVRQSFAVKLIGRSTFGVLDYSNMRPYVLPSGVHTLMYATTRTTRIPHMSVDAGGISPDIYLPPPVDDVGRQAEVRMVQHWLETGSFRLTPHQ